MTCNCYLTIRLVTSKATRGWGGGAGDNHKLTEKAIAAALLYRRPTGTAPQVAELHTFLGSMSLCEEHLSLPCEALRHVSVSLPPAWKEVLTFLLWDYLSPTPPILWSAQANTRCRPRQMELSGRTQLAPLPGTVLPRDQKQAAGDTHDNRGHSKLAPEKQERWVFSSQKGFQVDVSFLSLPPRS